MSIEVMPGAGRMLAEAREARGLTVAEVADKLKLTTRQVEALESEDYERLPAAVFVRGFVRNYARLLDLPPDSLLAVGESVAEPTEKITAHSEELRFSASPVRRWLLLPMAVIMLFLALVAGLYAWLSRGEEAYVPDTAPVARALPAPATPMVPATPVVSEPPPADPAAQVPADGAAGTPAAAMPGVAALPVVPAAPGAVPSAPPPPAPAAQGHVVQLAADQVDSWIEVVSADDKRYTRLLRTGEQMTLRGSPPFRLIVGNAATVRLTYDGRPIDLTPYIGNKVARLTLE